MTTAASQITASRNIRAVKISESDYRYAREMFQWRIETLDPDRKAELMLSGGVDSATVLFTMLESGRRPHCLTFQVGERESNDVRVAAAMCRCFKLEHTIVKIPQSEWELFRDVSEVISRVDWTTTNRIKKTIVQCVHPFLYLYPAMKGNLALCGLGGDSFYLTRRKEQEALAKFGDDYVSAWRRSYSADPDYSDYHIMALASQYQKTMRDFYDFMEMAEWIQRFTVRATHYPREKQASAGVYKDYWKQGHWYRPADRFQIGSGLRQYHELLLSSPTCNPDGSKAVIRIYNRIAREQGAVFGSNLPPRDSHGRLLDDKGQVYMSPAPPPPPIKLATELEGNGDEDESEDDN